jgi:hypothetical protein
MWSKDDKKSWEFNFLKWRNSICWWGGVIRREAHKKNIKIYFSWLRI